jgi:hypothetical protein
MNHSLPTPHGDKLKALLLNTKLPSPDRPKVEQAIERYEQWVKRLFAVGGSYPEIIRQMVALCNDYKYDIEVNLIFDSSENFLYRQKGQLKLDNTIIEEFLPVLVTTALANHLEEYGLSFGPTTCFSEIRFESSLTDPKFGGGMCLREKDHDFAISRKLYLQTSYQPDFGEGIKEKTHIAYVAAECKTNLDKTMFQEAAATALDVKKAVPGAKYYLLCEWLDMMPINSSTTSIDEILILRKARRLPANIRRYFSTASGRQANRELITNYLKSNPLSVETFRRFVDHIREIVGEVSEDKVLARGYF